MCSCAISHLQGCPPTEKSRSYDFCPSLNSSSIHEEKPAGNALLPKHPVSWTLPSKSKPCLVQLRAQQGIKRQKSCFLQDGKNPRRDSHETRSSNKTFGHLCPTSMRSTALSSIKSDSQMGKLSFSLKPEPSWIPPPPCTPNTSSQGYGIWLLPEKHRCCKRQEILMWD